MSGASNAAIAQAITWASGGIVAGAIRNATPARVINLSLSGPGSCPSDIQAAIEGAIGRGASVMVAAGNDNRDASQNYPGNALGCVTVGAVTMSGRRTSYSNYGSRVDVAAPVGVSDAEATTDANRDGLRDTTLAVARDTTNGPGYGYFWGTSGAAPIVAGVTALMYAANPRMTPAQVRQILRDTATSYPAGLNPEGCGSGIVNAEAAVRAALYA